MPSSNRDVEPLLDESSEPQVQVKLEPDEKTVTEAALPGVPAGNADLTYTGGTLSTDRTSAVVCDHNGEWVFSEHTQAQNLLQWVIALPRHTDKISALFLRHKFNKDALDFLGKWPLALKAVACGVSPEKCFIDASQSGGAAAEADGMLCTGSATPRVVTFEARLPGLSVYDPD